MTAMIQGLEPSAIHLSLNSGLGTGEILIKLRWSLVFSRRAQRLPLKIEVQPLRWGFGAPGNCSDCDLIPVNLLAKTPKS